jgi:hypothetical protein
MQIHNQLMMNVVRRSLIRNIRTCRNFSSASSATSNKNDAKGAIEDASDASDREDRGRIESAYHIGKVLSASGLNPKQVDALMDTIQYLRIEGKSGHNGFVSKLSHKADLSSIELESLKRISDLKHELSNLHHTDYRALRNEITQSDASTFNELSFLKKDLALLEVSGSQGQVQDNQPGQP